MQQINKLTLLGMSGIGKTYITTILNKAKKYYHYSADYRIGSKYLNSIILQNIKQYMGNDKYLSKLLDDEAIIITNNISFDNLSVVADFLGKIGNPQLGGLAVNEFRYRQKLHLNAEKNTMLDVPKFINRAKKQGIDNFINDAGGSLCELGDNKIYQMLSDNSLIVYIKGSDKTVNELIKRALNFPKPLYYNANFLDKMLNIYLKKNNLVYAAQINPDDFVRFVFPYLIEYRLPKYQQIADNYGITISADDMLLCRTANDFFELLQAKCR